MLHSLITVPRGFRDTSLAVLVVSTLLCLANPVAGQSPETALAAGIHTDTDTPAYWRTECRKDSIYEECTSLEMLRWVYGKVHYPQAAARAGIDGTVEVSFVIERDGRISDPRVVTDPGGGIGDAVVRAILRMNLFGPAWIPASLDGHPVRSRRTITLNYEVDLG